MSDMAYGVEFKERIQEQVFYMPAEIQLLLQLYLEVQWVGYMYTVVVSCETSLSERRFVRIAIV